MGEKSQPADLEAQSSRRSLSALLVCDLVGSTALVESLGDARAAEVFGRHDRMARDLLEANDGLEIDKTDGFLLLFERPLEAVRFALDYHTGLATLGHQEDVTLQARVGVHFGEVYLIANPSEDVARGAKPLEVEGLAKPMTARLMSVAQGGQTLLTRAAFDLARRAAVGEQWTDGLTWLAHGHYVFKGIDEPAEVYEVGRTGHAPLTAPAASAKVRRLVGDESILGWRPAPGQEIPQRRHWLLERKLGEGGFGEVWLANHYKTREARVFKFCFDSGRLRALKREVTVFRLLKEVLGARDDIARILDWRFDEPPYLLESEYTAGGSVIDWAEEQGGLGAVPLDTRLALVAQSAEALGAAHSVGVLHKDLKPHNVLVSTDKNGEPRARLTDFGIGIVADQSVLLDAGITALGLTETAGGQTDGSTSGTRLYLAPEVLEGKPATVQADIYALGVMLYQMVIGDLSRALAPGWERGVTDELLQEDLAACVDGDPERRLSSAQELASRLGSLKARRRLRQDERRRQSEAERALAAYEQSRQRRRLLLAALVVVAAFAATMTVLNNRISREAARANREAAAAREASNALSKALYLSRLRHAANAIDRWDVDTAKSQLDSCPEELRGWEWRRLRSEVAQGSEIEIKAHPGNVAQAVFSGDGTLIASCSGYEGDIKIWEAATGRLTYTVADNADSASNVAFRPGAKQLAVGVNDGVLRLISYETGEEIWSKTAHTQRMDGLAFSSDGKILASGSWDGKVKLWEASSGLLKATLELGARVRTVTFSPDGRWVLAGSQTWTPAGVRIWDVASGREVRTLLGAMKSATNAVAVSPDGRWIATGGDDGLIRLWLAKNGEEAKTLVGLQSAIMSVAFSPDGKLLASSGECTTIALWDLETEQVVRSLRGHAEKVFHVEFNPSGDRVVSSSDDGSVRVWSVADPGCVFLLGHEVAAWAGAFSPGGATVVTSGWDRTLRLWDATTGEQLRVFEGHDNKVIWSVVFSPDGSRIASGSQDCTIRVWDVASGAELRRMEALDRPQTNYDVTVDVAYSPDGKRLVSGGFDGHLRVWDSETGEQLAAAKAHSNRIWTVAHSADGTRIASGSDDGMIKIWTSDLARELSACEVGAKIYDVDFSPDSKYLVSGGSDQAVRVWDADSCQMMHELYGHSDDTWAVAFSPDGQRLASAGSEGTVKLWDPVSGQELLTLRGHQKRVSAVVFSPDGERILSCSGDQSARIWSARIWSAVSRN